MMLTSKEQIYSYCGLVVNILVFVAPIVQLGDVMETGDVNLFPFPMLVAAAFVSNTIWAEYSLRIHSIAYFVPNMLGLLMNGLQLAVLCYFWYYPKALAMRAEAYQQDSSKRSKGSSKNNNLERGYGTLSPSSPPAPQEPVAHQVKRQF